MAPVDASDFFEALPRDLVSYVLGFLSGFDLLPLSHVNRRFSTQFLGPNSECWARHTPRAMRVGPYEWHALATKGYSHLQPRHVLRRRDDPEAIQRWREKRQVAVAKRAKERSKRELQLLADAKRHYFNSVSVQFPGLTSDARRVGRWAQGRVMLREPVIRGKWSHSSFSFDLWMALLPVSSASPGGSIAVGGVVFSAQSSHWWQEDEASPAAAQFVHVDQAGGLYCSVAAGTKRVLATLSLSRWYHVALTFERSVNNDTAVQSVYLDGECIDIQQGALRLPDQWSQFRVYQLGTGFMDTDSVGHPEIHAQQTSSIPGLGWLMDALRPRLGITRQFRGNYTFHGLLDEFRLWRGALSAADVRDLALGRDHQVSKNATCDWSLTGDANYRCFHGDLWAVKCTRPTEPVCEGVRKSFRLWTRSEMRS